MSGGHELDVWPSGGDDCPLRRDRPVTCAAFVAMREWLGVSQQRFTGFFELGPATWGAIRRAAEPDFPGGPPLVGAPYALAARWVAHRDHVWLPPLLRPEPALLYAALSRTLGPDAPRPGTLALALGRDAGAAGAWFRDAGTSARGGPHAIVAVAAALLFCGPETLLAGRWRAWWTMARREAALRGIASLDRAGSWRVGGGRLVVPPGRWGARWRDADRETVRATFPERRRT